MSYIILDWYRDKENFVHAGRTYRRATQKKNKKYLKPEIELTYIL